MTWDTAGGTIGAIEAGDHPRHPSREEVRGRTGEQGYHQPFGDQHADETGSRRAQGLSQCQLPLPRGGAAEEQVRHVRAHDHQRQHSDHGEDGEKVVPWLESRLLPPAVAEYFRTAMAVSWGTSAYRDCSRSQSVVSSYAPGSATSLPELREDADEVADQWPTHARIRLAAGKGVRATGCTRKRHDGHPRVDGGRQQRAAKVRAATPMMVAGRPLMSTAAPTAEGAEAKYSRHARSLITIGRPDVAR